MGRPFRASKNPGRRASFRFPRKLWVDARAGEIYTWNVQRVSPRRLSRMLCQVCKQHEATVNVTEVSHEFDPAPPGGAEVTKLSARERHLCEACAQAAKLSQGPTAGVAEIWKLLQASQQKKQKREVGGVTCPDCGMTLREFRQRGRMGCPKDYEVFGAPLRDLLERIHGATQHIGRRPGCDETEQRRMQRIIELRAALDAAIRDEAYEAAAKLRDELKALQ